MTGIIRAAFAIAASFVPSAANAAATAPPSPAVAAPVASPSPPPVTPAPAPPLPSPRATPSATIAPAPTAQATAALPPSPRPSIDPAITARAKNWLHRAQTADIDRGQLDDKMKALLTPAFAKQIAAQMSSLGEPSAFEYVEMKTFPPNTLYAFKVTFGSDVLYWLFSTNPAGKITGFRLVTPPQ